MSDADGDGITVSEDGITVRKSLNTEQFKTPAVVFDIRSTRGESVPVQITDDIPSSIPPEDVGFHPAYGGDNWSISGDRVTFERSFEPDEEYTTVYGVRDVDDDALDDLLTVTPAVSVPDGDGGNDADEEGIDELVAGGNDLVRDVIKGERDSLPGVDDDAEEPAADPSFGMAEEADAGESPIGSSTNSGTTDFDDLAAEVEAEEAAADDGESGLDSPIQSDAGDGEVDSDPFDEVSVSEPADEADETDPLADIGSTSLDDEGEAANADPGASEGADVVDEAFDRPEVVTDDDIEDATTASEPDAEPADADESSDPLDTVVGADDSGESEDSPFEDTSDAGDDEDEQITVPTSGGVARVLAKELREGNVSSEDRQLLRDQLAVEEGSIAARIEHLQTRTSDLEAYTDALEEFLDHHGDPDEAFEDIHDEVEAVSTRTEDVAETVDSLEETIGDLESTVEDVTGDVDRVADDVETLTADLSNTDDQLQSTIDSVDRLDDRLASLAGDVETIEDQVSALESDLTHDVADLQESVAELEDLEDRLEGLERSVEDVQGVESEIASLRARVESVEQVAADVETLREEVDEMAAFRDQLSSAFGGGTDPE